MGIAELETKQTLKQKLKEKIVLEHLIKLGVTESQQGIPIYELTYEDLKHELVLASFREIDTQKDENRWF